MKDPSEHSEKDKVGVGSVGLSVTFLSDSVLSLRNVFNEQYQSHSR